MSLCLHKGAELLAFEDLHRLATPEPTSTHVPIAHAGVVDMVRYALGYHGHEIAEEHHSVTPDAMRYFGVLSLRSAYGDYTDTVGLRNSHDKKFPIGISFGSRVFVCDNLAFLGDHVIRRKHTAYAKRDLPGLVAEVVEPLRAQRAEQHVKFDRYRSTPLDESGVDLAVMQLYRRGAINVTRIAEVLGFYENPPFDWGDRSAWRLFNAITYALEGRIAEKPAATRTLHEVIDGVCEAA